MHLPTIQHVQAPVDLFVSTCFVNSAEEKAVESAQLNREQHRKGSELAESKRLNVALSTLEQNQRAGELRERMDAARQCSANANIAVLPVLHAEQAQQQKMMPTERLLRIPPQGFVLEISRGMLIGRLREMIAAKMGVEPRAVKLKLISQHTLCMPRSNMSSYPIENFSQEQVVETVGRAHDRSSPFFGFLCQKPPSTNRPAKLILDPKAPSFVPSYAQSRPSSQMVPSTGSQVRRGPAHLQEWQPSCQGQGQSAANCASESRPGKHRHDSCPAKSTSAGKESGTQVRSHGLAQNEHTRAREDLRATNAGKGIADVGNLEGSLVNAANATSAVETSDSVTAGIESHRLSSCTCTSSNDLSLIHISEPTRPY